MRCYRDRRWRFAERLSVGPEGEELYDLENDPHELSSLARNADFRSVRDRLWEALRQEAAVLDDPWPAAPASFPTEED